MFTHVSKPNNSLGDAVGLQELMDFHRHRFVDDFIDQCARLRRIDRLIAVAVNDLPLLVHYVVILERVLAAHVIALLDAFLRILDALVEPGMLEFLAVFEAEALHDPSHAVRRSKLRMRSSSKLT